MAVTAVETLIGGAGVDSISVNTTAIRFEGRAGADVVALSSGNMVDSLVYRELTDGAAAGATTGYDRISNFESGVDTIVLAGAIRSLVDDNSNGLFAGASRTNGQIDLSTDEVVRLTTRAGSLADADLASVRAAIGTLQNSSAGADALVLANNGTDTGLYLVIDANGDGQVGASEINLLGVFSNNANTTFSDVTVG